MDSFSWGDVEGCGFPGAPARKESQLVAILLSQLSGFHPSLRILSLTRMIEIQLELLPVAATDILSGEQNSPQTMTDPPAV